MTEVELLVVGFVGAFIFLECVLKEAEMEFTKVAEGVVMFAEHGCVFEAWVVVVMVVQCGVGFVDVVDAMGALRVVVEVVRST